MADYSQLILRIKNAIKENGEGSITGKVLQDVLVDMVQNYPEIPVIPPLPDVPNVIDNLNSLSSTDALSAKQGNVLLEMINGATGMNYMKLTSAAYDAAYQAGTLSDNILYIIVD